jgi:nickel transport system substrate-binding protein
MRAPSHADYQAQLGLPMKKEIDAKIGEVLLSTNEKKRADLYRWILSTLHEQAVYLPVSYMTQIIVHPKEISGADFAEMKNEIPFEKLQKQ